MNKTLAVKFALSVSTIVMGALIFSTAVESSRNHAFAAETAKPAPAWELKDTDGKTVKSTDFSGKVVILDFWATWCGPCKKEIPGFIELQKQYEKDGLVIIGVSLDDEGTKVVKKFMKKEGINYAIVMGNDKVTTAFGGVEAIPTTFVIGRDGKIAHKHVGYAEKSEFEANIKPLLQTAAK